MQTIAPSRTSTEENENVRSFKVAINKRRFRTEEDLGPDNGPFKAVHQLNSSVHGSV